MFGNIEKGLVERLVENAYKGDASTIPQVEFIGAKVGPKQAVAEEMRVDDNKYLLRAPLPNKTAWLEHLAGTEFGWRRALIGSPTIVQGSSYIDNPIRRLLAPRLGQTVTLHSEGDSVTKITCEGSARSYGSHPKDFGAVEVAFDAPSKRITVTVFEERTSSSIPLTLLFDYRPSMAWAPIHEVVEGRNQRIKAFYWKLWFGDDTELPSVGLKETFVGPEVVVDAKEVERFCSVVGNAGEAFKSSRTEETMAPLDFAMVTGWQVSIFTSDSGCRRIIF